MFGDRFQLEPDPDIDYEARARERLDDADRRYEDAEDRAYFQRIAREDVANERTE